jgi:hypothetical protein
MEWQQALKVQVQQGCQWVFNYCADIPDAQKGSIVRQENGLFKVQDGEKQNVITDLTAEQVPGALAQIGVANTGWE